MRQHVMRQSNRAALRSTLLQSAAVQRLATWNKVQSKPLSGSVQLNSAATSGVAASPPPLDRHSSVGCATVHDDLTPLRVFTEDSSVDGAAASGVLGSPVSRRMVSLSGAPWRSPSDGGLASPNGVMVRVSSQVSGGLSSPSVRGGRFDSMDGGAFALPAPAVQSARDGASEHMPTSPIAAGASAGLSSPGPSSPAADTVPPRDTRLGRVASRVSLSLVSPGTPVLSASSTSPSVSPPGARVRRDHSSASNSRSRVSREVETTEGRTDGQ
jgi:hypothetical protein